MKKFTLIIFIACISHFLWIGCGKEDCPTSPDNGVKENPSFANDIQPIFTANCAIAGCHSSAAAASGLDLSEGNTYDHLVNQPSSQEQDLLLVKPSDAENSYLVIKIEGRQTSGTQKMPINKSALSDDEIQLIRNWIDKGAEQN